MALKMLSIADITADEAIQPRAKGTDPTTVDDYAAAMAAGVEFPPVVVYRTTSGTLWLSQGFQRLAAARKAGLKKIRAEVRPGTRRDAVIDAAGSNALHGLRRTNADKRRAVEMLLKECPTWSDRKIAEAVAVGADMVGDCRKTHQVSESDTSTREGRDGKTYPAPSDETTCDETTDEQATDEAPEIHMHAGPERNGKHPSADDDEPSGVLASGGSADECRQSVEQMHRELARFQERLSGLMAGEFAARVKEAAEGNAFSLWTDGELQGGQAWGSVRYGVAKYACDPLDALLGFVGTLKVLFDRARSAPAGGRDTDDPYTLGKELRDPDIEF